MSRIIVEKELIRKTQQPQPQINYNKSIYDTQNTNISRNPLIQQDDSGKNNAISNSSLSPLPLSQECFHFQQVQPQNSVEIRQQQQNSFSPIIHISPFTPIQPLSHSKNAVQEFKSPSPINYREQCNILGTEMTAQEADDLFDNAEKLVGWSYWKIDE